MPDLVLTDVMGFKAGHSYEIAVVGAGRRRTPAQEKKTSTPKG